MWYKRSPYQLQVISFALNTIVPFWANVALFSRRKILFALSVFSLFLLTNTKDNLIFFRVIYRWKFFCDSIISSVNSYDLIIHINIQRFRE